jgi:hypothetical protein
MEIRVTGHNLKKIPLKDHPCHVCFNLDYWFQRRRFLNIFPNISSMVLRWSTAKIVFNDPDLGPKWPPSVGIALT